MPSLELGDIAEATGGALLRGDPTTRVHSYSIDTRAIERGGMFFALAGSRTDGHAFLGDALRAGAAAAVVQRDVDPGSAAPAAVIRVEDSAAALGRCGMLARGRCRARVIAVTGSTGKTTTKELIAAGLSVRRRVHRTSGNLNNQLGVPLTLLACPEDAEFQVIELGMSAPGEIALLAGIGDPDVALVTNVRPVHLQFFRSLDDIAAAKGELFAMLRPEATTVVNLDDPHVRLQATRHAGPRVTFGTNPAADVVLGDVEDRFQPGAAFSFRHAGRSRRVQLRLGGTHAAVNAVAALASVLAAGEDVDAASEGMAALEPGQGRGRVLMLARDVTVVDDAYNSNPAAMASVLKTLAASRPAGRRVLVMGDMLELGPEEAAYHREVGRLAAEAGVDLLVGVGPLSRNAVDEAAKAGVPGTCHEQDSAATARSLPGRIRPGDLVVIKGSRGIRLEKVVQALVGAWSPQATVKNGR